MTLCIMIIVIFVSLIIAVTSNKSYPCLVAKCAPGLVCHAVEANCGRPPCPMVARCMNATPSIDPCPFGKSILQANGRPFYCGGGITGRMCPRFTKCFADPTDKFAVCCWNMHPEDDYPDKPSSDTLAYDGVCPFIPPPYAVGACVEQCRSDTECLDSRKCCNTGCGHMCLQAVQRKPPFACPVPSENPFGICVDVCIFESDCKPHERCCSNGCGHVCMSAQAVSYAMNAHITKNTVRPGFCPPEETVRYIECSEKEQCTKDDDCFGIRKCCFNDQCGHICLNPKNKQLTVDAWLYEWKNKWFH